MRKQPGMIQGERLASQYHELIPTIAWKGSSYTTELYKDEQNFKENKIKPGKRKRL